MSETPSTSYSVNQPNSSESERSLSTRHFNVTEPVVAKRICFYKSGDPQFNGIKMVINDRSYKTFDALLDSLSKRVPLPFGVRNISTPKGRHSITNLEDLEDGKSYICSHQRKMKPINLEQASKKPLPWQISRPVSARRRAVQLARENEDGFGHRERKITTPKKMLVFKNGDVRLRRTIVLGKKNTQTFEAFLDYMSELMQYPVVKLYTTDGRKVPNLQALILCSGALVAAGREPFKPSNYDFLGYSRPAKLLGIANRVYPKANAKSESENTRAEMGSSSRSQIFSVSSDKGSSNDNNSNDNNSDSSYVPDSHNGIGGNQSVTGEHLSVAQYEDDIEKSVHLNQDGSITVEMKVRFKIKEEETIKWTTTVSRDGLSHDKNATICNSAMCAEDCLSNVNVSEHIKPKDTPFLKRYNKEEGDSLQQSNAEVSDKESESDLKTAGCNICKKNNSADLDVSNVPEDNIRPRFYRPPTPGPRRVRQKKAVVESVTLVSDKEVQEKTIGQFSYSEEIQNGENKSEYCMVAHSSRKKSSVSNPKFSEMSDNDLLKFSSENIKEEMLFKVSHKSNDLIEATNRKTLEAPDEDELVQNILDKSVVEQGTCSSLVSTCKANISGFIPSSKIYQAGRPSSADHIHESCDIKQIKRSLSSFIRYAELCQSKEEKKCKAADLLPISQDSVHSACSRHNQMKVTVPPCSKAPTEKTNPTIGFFPTVTESENQISVRTESVTATHLIDDNQSPSSLTKKKKKRKSSDFLEQGTYENQKDKEISEIIKSEGMHITSKPTQDSTTEAMDNYSEMPQKKGTEFFVKNNDGSVNSDKNICPEDEFCHQDSVELNGLLSNKKPRSNNKVAKVKLKSGKKNSIISSAKSEDGLMTVDANNESEHSQDTLSTEKEGTHVTTNSFEQTPNSPVISKPLSEVPKNLNFEKEKEKNILEDLSSKKEKKQKGMKKNLSKGANKLNMSERAIALEALKQKDFQEEVAEHSLENYVQTWLKNLLPNSVLPPINKKEGNVENSNVCHFPKENADASIDKETRFIANKVHVTGKNHLVEHNLTKKTLKPICELGTLEESAKNSGEKQTNSLVHANTTIVEEAKYSLKSEFHHYDKLHLFRETHDNDKKMSEVDIQDTNLCQRKKSEVAVQVDCAIVNEKMGIDVQNNCMSSMLLHELQSTLLGLQKEHSGCIGKACSLSDLSPSAFGSSSNVLLAWLLVLNLRDSLIGTIKDDMQKTTCSCSEIFTQLQFLKQTTVIEKVDELKAAFSHFQQSTENNLLHFGKELKKQDSTHCRENMPISEIHNGIHLHENENSVEPCIPKDSVNSEEALKLAGELESCFDIQKDLCRETETLDLSAPKTQLDGQYANTNSNTCSLVSAIEPPERNEEIPDDNLYKKSQDKNTDTSFTNEESETSVEPNSTVHSLTSNDKNRILDQDTSELEGEKDIIHVTTDKSEDEKVDPKSAGNDKKPNNQVKLAAETSVEYNTEDYSVQEDKEDAETCEETSERLSTLSPLSFCYESKQITECDISEGEQKLQVEELENKICSDTSQLKKCLKSPGTSDWSDYRPDTEESDYNFRASSDLTNESGEEAVLEKHYNTGYVKRTIERLYGKTEASFKADFHKGFPYMSKVFQKDTEEFHSAVVEKNIYFSQEPRSCSAEKLSYSSLPSQEFPVNLNKDVTILRRENTSLPTPQPTLNREETSYTNDHSGESPKQHCQPSVRANEDEGILIDKGKWLLKENHLIRRSPPEQIGMYGNLDTTSTDTVLDTNSDDVPYSHFGNPNQYPVLNEISSSELEDMAKPSENFCNYFNIPHNSDSDPFQDDLGIKSKPSRNGKTTSLPAANKEKIKPSVMVGSTSTQADTNFPAFTSVEFRLPDNKVHPLEQPLNYEPIQSQPTDVSNANRSALQEEDSLDKLHAICGQHCPILMVTVTPINEKQRGYAYQKASDIENQLGPCLLAKKSEHLQWSGEDLITDENNHVTLKNNCINKIANNIFNRFYANNTLDFISNFGILASSTLKDTSSLGKLHVIRRMNIKPVEVSNCQNNVSKQIPSDLVIGTNSELPNRKPKICQTLRISLIHIFGEKFSPMLADPAETRHSEAILKCDTSLHNIGHNASENLKNEDASPTEEEEAEAEAEEAEAEAEAETEAAEEEAEGEEEAEEEVCFCTMDNGNTRKWKVSVLTSDMPSAGTSSKVYITLYGDHSSSGPIFLDGEEGKLFQRGNEDIFTVNTGNIGHLYKIRIGHTNAGNSPAWHCEEVQLLNLFSGEQFSFPAHRWLAWDQADGEISVELPVLQQGQPIHPVTVYEVHVTTGELWNAGTEADVYISVYGERGDTGSRQLLRSQKPKKFLKGQTDIFAVEAVHLGHLYKIVIGHNGLGSGNGWFLDKVVIKDPITDLDYTFLCHRWLDQGQDDGNIARDLTVTDASTFPGRQELELKREETWAAEKWKFQEGNTLQFYNRLTRGFICLSPDSRVDALGDKKNKYGFFDVNVKKRNICIFSSHQMPRLALALVNGHVIGKSKDKTCCELCVHLQPNGCAILESARNPGHTVTFSLQGKVADETTGYAGLSKEFVVHVKGVFHHGAIILLNTSLSQALSLRPDGSCSGAGQQQQESYWKVHKIGSGVCMFESVRNPRMYLKIKDDQCNGTGTGDEYCHFKIEKSLETGSVSLESVRNKGMYVGLLPDGQTKPVINTGERNIFFYPQVIKFGREEPMGTSAAPNQEKKDFRESQLQPAKVQKPVSQSFSTFPPSEEMRNPQGGESPLPSDDEWKVSMLTGNTGTEANVILWIYGDRGVAGPITLGKDNRKQLFLPRQEDEFQVKIKSIGSIYKIRIELDEFLNEQSEWNLQRVTLQHLKSKKTLNFPENTWLSKNRDDRDFLCELPVVEAGKPIYPIVLYHVYVYTGDMEQADTDRAVYLCIYGKRGDSGLRLLHKSGIPVTFQRGMVNAFEVEAVSLGKLQKVLLRCEASAKSQYWYCDKVIVREAENNLEYVFNCERWLPFMSQGVIHSEIELYPQEFQINQQLKMQEEANEGDWKITVVTGDFETAGTTATVSLYVYGENKASGPIILGSGKHQLFNPNSEDTFKINLRDLGQLYKIRIGHDNTGNDPSWYLEEVRLERVVPLSDEEICLPIECWLAEDKGEGDTWREVAIRNPTKELLPLLVYEVHVYTGAKLGAETDSNVYVNLIGTRGDAGKRKLHRSKNNNVKFQRGQMDIFCIKAVSLGDLEKVLISHDGAGPGNGWFLDKIIIKHKKGKEAQEVVFPCNRWLDEYQDDGKTERELTANKDSNSTKAFLKAQQWRVQVKTDGDSPEPQECKRTLVIYGSKGKSDELLLSPQKPGYACFLPRATDEFIVGTGDLGDVYKIRVSCDDVPGFEGWHLKSFRLEELHTKQELNFDCNCWLSHNREDKELVKEFPAVNEDQKTLPVYKYVVSVHVGDCWGAETFANVYITLYGKRGDTGVRKLHTSLAKGRKFQRNKVDSFLVKAVSLSHLQKVVIGHDGEGYGAGMYLKMVTVKESQDSDKEWVFPLWNWLDTHLGLCETVCEIVTVGRRLTSSPKLPEINMKSSGLWIMDITGSDLSNKEDPICLSFIFYGNLNRKKLPLQVTEKAIQIKDELADIGSIHKVQVTGPHSELKQPWHLDLLHMKHTGTKEEMYLAFDCWFNPNEDKCVELPALYADQEPLPETSIYGDVFNERLYTRNSNEDKRTILKDIDHCYSQTKQTTVVEYAIHLYTGDLKKADATGEAYLCIQGAKSDSGKRWLNSRNSLITFARGQVNVLKIKAVYLGKLNQVLVGFKSLKKDEWFLEKIVIKEVLYPFPAHVFVHNDWINKRSKKDFVEVAIPLKETSVSSLLTKNFDTKSRGRWQTWVHCTQVPEGVPDIHVVVFGSKGKSPAQKVQNLYDNPFLLTVGDIGDITKVSFVLSSPCLGRGIILHKLQLKDLDTKQELGFHTEARCLFGEDGSETVTELAAVRPDKPPLREVLYSINVHTGTLPASGTDADVFITVFGDQGDSCKRRLRHSNFERGQVCISEMRAVDLGQLSKVLVEHHNVGYGAGWYLDQIVIHESGKTDGQYAFLCQQWLDSGVGDAQTERMLKLLGKVRNGMLTGKIYGTWDVLVTTSDISSSSMNPKMSLTVCGEKGTCTSVMFPKGCLKKKQIYETSIELNKKFNTIFKVRLEIEEAGEGETWHCQEVKLQHRESKNVLEFPFCRNFADEEGERVAELPVLTAGSPFPAVKSYVLYITTGATPGSGTDADVYVMLQGLLGDTGRRKLIRKGDDNFSKGKVDIFQVEAVDVGTLQGMVVEKGKGSDWLLEKIIVKESAAAGTETVFMAQTWLKDRRNGKRSASVTLNVTEIQERRSTSAWPLGKEQMNSEGRWRIYFTKHQEETKADFEKLSENISKLVMIFYGSNGKSNPVSMENKVEHQAKNQITYDIHLPSDLGMLYKVRLGLQSLENSISQLSLCHFKMQNTSTLDTFSLTIDKTLPLSLNGDRWIEFPIEWPLKEALSVVTYHLTVFSRNILSERNLVHLTACIYGTHGDTGDRSLLWSLKNVQQGEDNESFLVIVEAVELGELDKVVLLISSKTDCKLDIKKLHLKEAVKEHPIYVFEVNEAFSVDANKPEIQREILVSFVIRGDKQKNDIDNNLHKEGSQARNLTEYTIKVYTGDKRGAGTDANVHIILFGNEDKSEVFQLSQSLEHQDPFERGKVDTFKIKTKKLGSLHSIEIGHDGKGFASGWFLEKVEITDASRNSVYCFNCNRWLAEDENDGRTIVKLYPELLDF